MFWRTVSTDYPLEEKRLLQTAAVIGVHRSLAAAACRRQNCRRDDLHRYVSHLQTAEFLYETNLFPEVEYAFKHALTTEVAYGALLHERRTLLHAHIVKALEEMTESIPHDHLEKLAHHAFQGELWDKAVAYSKRMPVLKAMSNSAFLVALSSYERAFQALEHFPESREKLEQPDRSPSRLA